MNYQQQIDAYKKLVIQAVASKVSEDSIDPGDVASIGLQIADMLLPIINTINDFGITGGTLPPNNVNGIDLDLYIQGGTSLVFWRKRSGIWVAEASVELGIQIVDGNITLQASVNEQVVTVSAGSWGINNIIYSKATQTQLNLTAADLNFNRIDTIVADATGAIYLLNGVASSNPNPAALPANSIVVAYVYIPSSSSGDLPYISDSNSPPVPIYDVPKPWTSEPTPLDGYRSFIIDDVEYFFRSLVEGNTSQPSIEASSGAWIQTNFYGFISTWSSFVPYNEGSLVTGDANTKVYKSKVSGNAGNIPSGGVSTAYWEYVGVYKGFYNPGIYDDGDVVIAASESNRIYISNIPDNEQPLTDVVGASTWNVIGAKNSGSNIGSVDKPSTGDLDNPTGVYTFTDEELALIGNDPAVSAYVTSDDAGNTVETFYPDITPITTKDSDGKLISIQVDFGEDGGMIRFTGANAGVSPTPGGETPDATTTVKGKIKLAGDLAGTADAPTVPGLALKAPLESPALTGTPTAPTQSPSDNSTKIATTEYVDTALDNKVDKEIGKGLSENDYTDAEKTKLANLSDYFKGRYASLAALQSAFPIGEDGDYATVDTVGVDAITYIWDETDAEWVPGNPGSVTTVNGQTGAVILDADDIGDGTTNKAYTATEKTKLAAITGTNTGDNATNSTSNSYADGKVQNSLSSSTTVAPSATAVNVALADKANIAAAQVTLTALTFTSDSVSGTISSPITGNLTGDVTGAKLGVTVLVIHNNGTEPTFDSKFKKLSGSGDYVTGQVNYIYCQYIDATHIVYSINQSA
ncbi:hypothetical protein [Pedobacter africanus]|uniref:Uncharacterized protein n=1 Tax=Pedobacter africanus TaxID=151894 RepID=A0A1W1ZCA6_9SPHI|nr:hypothetical protein [Pedobacter africanus]SMC45678.1 hypothetical protein SAMN04488524_0558 [Pedobacter africanus]